MTDDIGSIAGYLFISMICGWAVWFLASQLRSNIASGKAVDRTLSQVEKRDAPGMFWLQVVGFVLLIGASAAIGIGAMVALVRALVAQ